MCHYKYIRTLCEAIYIKNVHKEFYLSSSSPNSCYYYFMYQKFQNSTFLFHSTIIFLFLILEFIFAFIFYTTTFFSNIRSSSQFIVHFLAPVSEIIFALDLFLLLDWHNQPKCLTFRAALAM